MRRSTSFLVALVIFSSGCAVQTAQNAIQRSLTTLAVSIDETDTVVRENVALAGPEARAEAESYDEYRAAMYPWDQLIVALEGSTASVQAAQETLDVWKATDVLPESWGQFCDEIGQLLDRVLALLAAVDVDVPGFLEEAVPHVGTACNIIADWAGGNP